MRRPSQRFRMSFVLGALVLPALALAPASAAPPDPATDGAWQPLVVGTLNPDGSQTIEATLVPPGEAATAATEVIVCNIETAGWRISGAWQVQAELGPITCSTAVYHQQEFKTVKRVCFVVCWWSDQRSISRRVPTSGYSQYANLWTPKLGISGGGTYHIHLRDVATAISGSSAMLIDADGPNFTCVDGTGCHY
jgi:hypothetical protein